ncbi:MAG: hypothetical protein JXA81_10265, partial [Sedimentisphaerales bacterium]|nr:hypothetical protein [Sedimentisphaerales bacterium]
YGNKTIISKMDAFVYGDSFIGSGQRPGWVHLRLMKLKKQSQIYLAPRFILGVVENQFEKTKPIL